MAPMSGMNDKKLHIRTWGCQMNVYDSARMVDVLGKHGYSLTEDPAEADIVILNTCHIREKAAEKVFSELGRLRRHKIAREQAGKTQIIGVAGCLAQAEGGELIRRMPFVDLVFGTQAYHRLPEMIAEVQSLKRPVVSTDFPAEDKFDALPDTNGNTGPSAFLAIQEGCNNFCTYCVVPYTRGAEYARPAEQVLREAERLVLAGAKEITLLGQNVNAWRGRGKNTGDEWPFSRLLIELAEISGLARLRYTTSHPTALTDDLIRAHACLPQLMPFLHLPAQSGSDHILAAMNRGYSRAEYVAAIAPLRSSCPDMALSSDFIVGFPGETDADFEDTMSLVREIGYAQAYSFKFSPRPGTPAAAMDGQVPEDVMNDRLQALQTLITQQQAAFNAPFAGRTLPVLFDARGNRPGQLHGRSPWMQAVHAEAPDSLFGEIADVLITRAGNLSLTGTLAKGKEP